MAKTEDSLWGHLAELRLRLIKSLLAWFLAFIICYNFSQEILTVIFWPLKKVLPPGVALINLGLQDPFLIHLKAGLWGGLILASPYLFYQFWAFIAPGLYRTEKKMTIKFTLMALGLMLLGLAFAYWIILPITFQFLFNFSDELMKTTPAGRQYFSLATSFLLTFVFVFQIPLVFMFLGHLGLIDAGFLRRYRRYAIVIIFILAAIFTPPDPFSQFMMAIPMILLYELSIFLLPEEKKSQELD